MLDKKDDALTDKEKNYIQSMEKELKHICDNDSDTDGEAYAMFRLQDKISNLKSYAQDRKVLQDRNISFTPISGGFIIQSPTMAYRRYYYYVNSCKWRQEGKSKYYLCKDINDLLDRFILNTIFKCKKR